MCKALCTDPVWCSDYSIRLKTVRVPPERRARLVTLNHSSLSTLGRRQEQTTPKDFVKKAAGSILACKSQC